MKAPLILAAALLTAACLPTFQTTSAADYFAARPDAQIDPEIRAAAQVGEAQLQFPARIAVVQTGRYSQIPAQQMEPLITRAAQAGLGQVFVLNPILAEGRAQTLSEIRQLAARQHADYVLVLQSHRRGGQGEIYAAFVDVRNGYPYASAQASAGVGWADAEGATRRLMRAIRPDLEAMVDGLAARAGR